MSKIFEALQHAEMQETSNLRLSVLSSAPSEATKEEEHEPPSDEGATEKGTLPAPDAVCRFIEFRSSALSFILPCADQNKEAAEQYRIIRTKIIQHSTHCSLILVTSACAGDGKSITSLNLAYTMALKRHTPVLLLSGDIRRFLTEPALQSRRGLTDVLAKQCSIEDALIVVKEAPNLHLLPSGTVRADAPEWFDSSEWQIMIPILQKRFKYIIIDAPPFGAVSDYYHLQSFSEGIVFVVRPEHTSRDAFSAAMKAIPRQKLLGVVVNDARRWLFWRQNESYVGSRPLDTASVCEGRVGIEQHRSKHAL